MKEFWYQSKEVEVDREWFSSYEDAEQFAKELSANGGWCNIVEYYEDRPGFHWIAAYVDGKKAKVGRRVVR
jgi:hypothetical protein